MPSGESGPVVAAALASDVRRFTAAEPDVIAGKDDSIHQMRVSTRRLRSVLRTFRGIFDRASVRQIRAELTWFAGVLGPARDAEVLSVRLDALILRQRTGLVIGPIAERLVTSQRNRYDIEQVHILDEFDGIRFGELRRRLADFAADPPFATRASRPATIELTAGLSHEHHRLGNDIRAAFAAGTADRTPALHEVRKSAKRLRYAAEAAAPVLGAPADRIVRATKSLQTVLGDHRDAVQSQQLILTTAAAARRAGEDTFGYGLLYTAEEHAASAAFSRYPAALESVTDACASLDARALPRERDVAASADRPENATGPVPRGTGPGT